MDDAVEDLMLAMFRPGLSQRLELHISDRLIESYLLALRNDDLFPQVVPDGLHLPKI